MHFEFHNKTMQNLDVAQTFLQKLKNKNLTIIGDSIELFLFQSVVEALRLKGEMAFTNNMRYTCFSELKRLEFNDRVITARISHGYNGYLKYINVYTILKDFKMQKKEKAYLAVSYIEDIINKTKHDGILMLNYGLHYHLITFRSIMDVMSTLSKRLASLSNRGVQIIYKMTSPQHFATSTGTGWYEDLADPQNRQCVNNTYPARHFIDSIAKQYASQHGFSIFDDFDIFTSRWDMHPFRNTKGADCTHYCFSMETVMPQLALLTHIL